MIDVTLKGILNQHSILEDDVVNIVNKDNAHYFSQVLLGNTTSPSVEYLMNLGSMMLKDAKSIYKFNAMRYAEMLKDVRVLEEITDGCEVILPSPSRKLQFSLSAAILQRRSERLFSSASLSMKELSTLLHYSFGTVEFKNEDRQIKQTKVNQAKNQS